MSLARALEKSTIGLPHSVFVNGPVICRSAVAPSSNGIAPRWLLSAINSYNVVHILNCAHTCISIIKINLDMEQTPIVFTNSRPSYPAICHIGLTQYTYSFLINRAHPWNLFTEGDIILNMVYTIPLLQFIAKCYRQQVHFIWLLLFHNFNKPPRQSNCGVLQRTLC